MAQKVATKIAISQTSYVFFEILKFAAKQCYQKGHYQKY